MCGIFAYYTDHRPRTMREVVTMLFKGLKRLEYRGYDSAGLCVDRPGQIPFVFRSTGRIESLETVVWKEVDDLSNVVDSQSSIAHTRWATHGPPSVENSHPHVSDPEVGFAVVHNGIITNYQSLKDFLMSKGETFESDTDTEVIPKMCGYVRSSNPSLTFPELVQTVLSQLRGAYAILVKSTHFPGELIACRRGSPVIFGVQAETAQRVSGLECWVASDAAAIVEHTRRVIVLEDEDVLHIKGQSYTIYNTGITTRQLLTLNLSVDQIMKGSYDHFMQKEIHEQPESIASTLKGRATSTYVKLGGLVDFVAPIKRSRRIMLIGCGTSYHACLASRPVMEEMCQVPVTVELASDFLDRRCPIFRDDTCVFVSQSGETADTLRALEYAKARGSICVGITNTVGSAISRATHCGIHQNAGPEIGVASTKAYTSQIVCLMLLALTLAEDSVRLQPRCDDLLRGLHGLPDAVRKTLALEPKIKGLAEMLKEERTILVLSRGYNYATVLEAALKLKEIALIHSEGLLAGELKHGPLALVDEHLTVLVVATRDAVYEKMKSVIQQLLARNARLVILCSEGDKEMERYDCTLIRVPETVDALQPVLNIVPLQLLAYHLTVLRGNNVDQPRNLAKSVTVSEEF